MVVQYLGKCKVCDSEIKVNTMVDVPFVIEYNSSETKDKVKLQSHPHCKEGLLEIFEKLKEDGKVLGKDKKSTKDKKKKKDKKPEEPVIEETQPEPAPEEPKEDIETQPEEPKEKKKKKKFF